MSVSDSYTTADHPLGQEHVRRSGISIAQHPGQPANPMWVGRKLHDSAHSLRNKLVRVLWSMAYLVLFRPSPRVFHGWRRLVLRCFGAKVGRKVRTFPNVKIWAPWNLELGDYCVIGDAVDCYSVGRLVIGHCAMVSQYSILCTASHDPSQLHLPLVVDEVILEPYVWLCAQTFVMPGVRIGEGTVVGARSMVRHNLPSWKIVAGSPCRIIRPREIR